MCFSFQLGSRASQSSSGDLLRGCDVAIPAPASDEMISQLGCAKVWEICIVCFVHHLQLELHMFATMFVTQDYMEWCELSTHDMS